MDWFEVWFGISPGNGDGSLELLVVLVVVALTAGLVLWASPRLRRALIRTLTGQRTAEPASDPANGRPIR